MSSRYDLMK